MSNKKQKIIIFIVIIIVIIILAGFGFAGEVLASYYSQGTLTSINLLSGLTVTSIDSFWYNAFSIPTGTSLKAQFSQNNTNWYNSSGTENGWDDCTTTGGATISLSTLGWSGPNFYYKIQFNSNAAKDATPVVEETRVNYSSNTAPTVSNVSLNNENNITLNENTTTSVSATADISDAQGCNTITNVTAKIYRSGVGSSCTADNNNCYSVASCTETSCSGTDAVYTCTINMEYYADPTDAGTYSAQNWMAWVKATDSGSLTDDAYSPTGTTPDVKTLLAFSLSTDTIDYGTMSLGTNTGATNQKVNIINTGNVRMDVMFDGYGASDGDGKAMVCATGSIILANEKYDISDVTYASLSWALTDTATERDWDVLQRTNDSAKTQDEDQKWSYWGLAIPTGGCGGTCSGYVTFTAVNDAAGD